MSTSDYERYRRRLEEELRADVELIYAGYLAKLRAYETVARVRGELEGDVPLGALTLSLPPASSPREAAPTARRALAAPAPPPPKKRSKTYEVIEAMEEALEKVDEVFDKVDLCRAMGFQPSHASFHRAINELTRDELVALHEPAYGRRPARFRKLSPAAPAPS